MIKYEKSKSLTTFIVIWFICLFSISSAVASTEYQIAYSTYLGGEGTEGHGYLHFDSTGECVLISCTDSLNFPLKKAIQTDNHGERDILCLKLGKQGESILYSTFLGGTRDDFVSGSTVDSQGNIIIVGVTSSTDFPLQNALVETKSAHERDVFVVKLSSDGQNVIFSSYLGAASDNYYTVDVTTDSVDNIIITGSTIDSDFIIQDAYQENKSIGADAFITKLTPDGQNVIFSTFFGGSNDEQIKSVTIDKNDDIIFIGVTSSNEFFPIKNALIENRSTASWDVFLSKVTSDGQELIFSTFYGGTRAWGPAVILCDSNNNILAGGETDSQGFPVKKAYQKDYGGGVYDSFLTKLSPDGQEISFSTYFGGNGHEGPSSIIIDSKENIFMTGSTSSSDLEVKNAYQSQNNGGWDGYLVEFSPDGQELIFSSYFGGVRNDYSTSIALVPGTNNSFLITGHADSRDLPVKNPLQDTYGGGDFDLFICRFETSRGDGIISGFDIITFLVTGFASAIFLNKKKRS